MTKSPKRIKAVKPENMSQKELKDWVDWAKGEILEYQNFIKELVKYINR